MIRTISFNQVVHRLLLIALAVILMSTPTAHAAGSVTDCSNYGSGAGTLQDALSSGGTIVFACSGTIVVPEIVITSPTIIDASGQTVTLSGSDTNRVLRVASGATLELRELTISEGFVTNADGGALHVESGALADLIDSAVHNSFVGVGHGGGIYNAGTLGLLRTTVSGNETEFASGGGGVFNDGDATLTESDVSNNTARQLSVALDPNNESGGGGLHNRGALMIIDSTVTDNVAEGYGGGIFNRGTLNVSGSAISRNGTESNGGGSTEYLGGGIASNGASTFAIADSVILANESSRGGGVADEDGLVIGTITDSEIEGNRSSDGFFDGMGGGLYIEGDVTVSTSRIHENFSESRGAGVHVIGALQADDVEIAGNLLVDIARDGGGVYVESGTLTMTGGEVVGNGRDTTVAPLHGYSGGGIYGEGGVIDLSDVDIHHNNVGPFGEGGGIYNLGSSVFLAGVAIHSHIASEAAAIWNQGSLTAFNSTFADNENLAFGKAVYNNSGTMSLDHVTIANNRADVSSLSAGLHAAGTAVTTVKNSMVAANSPGYDCEATGGAVIQSLGHNLESSNTCSFSEPSDFQFSNPQLGALQANGGPTPVLFLLGSSPAIDAIPSGVSGCGSTITTDQRGELRPVDADGFGGAACDIGAFELGTGVGATLTISIGGSGDGTVTSTSGTIACPGDCSEPYSAATQVSLVPTVGLDSVFAGWEGDCSGSGMIDVITDVPLGCTAVFEPENQPPSVTTDGPYSASEGTTVIVSASGSDPDGDPISYDWDLDGDGTFETPGQSASVFAADGPATINLSVRATDSLGQSTVDTTILSVYNVGPALGPIGIDSLDTVAVGTAVHVSASFADPAVADSHSAVWDWGDGTSAGVVDQSADTVSGSHTYSSVGIYTLKLSVSDDDFDSDESQYEFIVVYDPAAGSVRGNGKIVSPVGACTLTVACETASGDATFGFASKYRSGKSTPDGRTRFVFRAGDLTFVADKDMFEWLIVSGHRARFKGSGQINHGGDYGFMLTGLDGDLSPAPGDVDTFRIRIWDKSTDEVIYDNQRGAADGADATTTLERGEIKIVQ